MPRTPDSSSCPCGSGQAFSRCCLPLLEGQQQASSAAQLMRSRYTAFALGYCAYLVDTHHPDYRKGLSITALQTQDQHTRWLALKIIDQRGGSSEELTGVVHFVARYLEDDSAGELEERSRFIRQDGVWYYTDGEPAFRSLGRPGRNSPCPCGSGKKFKRCHQR